jgi:uncharacterized protein
MSIGASIDGCPTIHNYNRSNSMAAILKDWDWYKDYTRRKGSTLSTKSTLNSISIPYLRESVEFLHREMEIRDINMNFIFEKMDPEPDLLELERQFDKIIEYLLSYRHEVYFAMFDLNRMAGSGPVTADSLDKGWCGSGAMPCLGVDGLIYPCFRFTSLSIPLRESTRGKISDPKCLDCYCESSCAWCIAGAYMESGKLYRQTHICDVQKLTVKYARKYWDEFERLEGYRNYSKKEVCRECHI